MTKLTKIAVALMVVGMASAASADPLPVPEPYAGNGGPFPTNANATPMTGAERHAFALMEAVMQIGEAKAHNGGCSGSWGVDVYASDFFNQYYAEIGSALANVRVDSVNSATSFRGNTYAVTQATPGALETKAIGGFTGTYVYNAANNMMVGEMSVSAMSVNSGDPTDLDEFTGYVIKDFYMGSGLENKIIFDWGLQSLSKLGYPVEKWWQRSKAERSNGAQGCTIFVKDRLVGTSACRIKLALTGPNTGYPGAPNEVNQSGTLSISVAAPNDDAGFSACGPLVDPE